MRIPYSAALSHLLLAGLCVFQAWAADPASLPEDMLTPVRVDLTMGRADDAISHLRSSLTANPQDAEAHNLLCRVYFQEEQWDDAIGECETAVRLKPLDSEYHLWLGRAYGEKARSMHSIKAYELAKKVRREFERAVELDNGNADALSDLGEFYTAAPGIVGGDKKKAQVLAQTLEQYEPAQACQLQGSLAEKNKNYALAESEYKAEAKASSEPADAWMDLAAFYSRRREREQMLQALHAGIDADRKAAKPNGPALVDAAALLSRNNEEPQLAIQLLRLYLASPNQSADSPAFQVHVQLSRLLEQQGDNAGATQQIEAAAALASEYHPAAPKAVKGDELSLEEKPAKE
jgi:Flp pilus assembly protein TadD